MLKKTITYTDYNDVERTEDFYFNLTQTELTVMNASYKGGMRAKLERIIQAQDEGEIVKVVKDIVHQSYGEKSDDGRRFIKSDELSTAFEQTEAYNKLFVELTTGEEAMSAFINGILPKIN